MLIISFSVERPEESPRSLHYLLLSGLTADGVETYLSVLFDDDKVNSVVMLGGGTARAEVIADNESKCSCLVWVSI